MGHHHIVQIVLFKCGCTSEETSHALGECVENSFSGLHGANHAWYDRLSEMREDSEQPKLIASLNLTPKTWTSQRWVFFQLCLNPRHPDYAHLRCHPDFHRELELHLDLFINLPVHVSFPVEVLSRVAKRLNAVLPARQTMIIETRTKSSSDTV